MITRKILVLMIILPIILSGCIIPPRGPPDNEDDEMAVETIRPDADGNYTDWDPAVGSHWDKLVDDSDSTKISEATVNDRDSHTYANPTGISAGQVIHKITTRARCIAVPGAYFKFFIRISSTDYDSSTNMMPEITFQEKSEDWLVNPATSLPWTLSDINALEVGALKSTSPGNGVEISEMYVDITYGLGIRINEFNRVAGSGLP